MIAPGGPRPRPWVTRMANLTISEAAQAWGVHRDTVRHWIRDGKIEGAKGNDGRRRADTLHAALHPSRHPLASAIERARIDGLTLLPTWRARRRSTTVGVPVGSRPRWPRRGGRGWRRCSRG